MVTSRRRLRSQPSNCPTNRALISLLSHSTSTPGRYIALDRSPLGAITSFLPKSFARCFKVESGDIFSPVKMRQALEQMRSAYVERHYLNFTTVPETSIDDSR